MNQPINIIFDGPPSHESGRFVEVETDDGKSINAGEWIERADGFWALRITSLHEEARMKDIRIAQSWDSIPPILYDGDEAISTRKLEKDYRDAIDRIARLEGLIRRATIEWVPDRDVDLLDEVRNTRENDEFEGRVQINE